MITSSKNAIGVIVLQDQQNDGQFHHLAMRKASQGADATPGHLIATSFNWTAKSK